MSLGRNTFNARLRWTSTFEGQRILYDWIPVFNLSDKANEWLLVIPPDALIEECPWGGDKVPEPAERLEKRGGVGGRRGRAQTHSLGLCGPARREGEREQAWLMSVCGWWRVGVPTRPCVTSALNGFINFQPLSHQQERVERRRS